MHTVGDEELTVVTGLVHWYLWHQVSFSLYVDGFVLFKVHNNEHGLFSLGYEQLIRNVQWL